MSAIGRTKKKRIRVERNDAPLFVRVGKGDWLVSIRLEPDEIELDARAATELAEFLLDAIGVQPR